MANVMGTVASELKQATTWLSTNDLVIRLDRTHGSVGRALRRLWLVGKLSKKKVPNDRYGRVQWIHIDNVNKSFTDAKPPTSTVYVKKGSPQLANTNIHGDLIMQIEQGVETIVREWVTAKKKFSAHDVTKELRERVNSGTLQVDPGLAGTAVVGGNTVTKIEHTFVNDAVRAFMASSGFDYDRLHNGTYFEYFPMQTNTVSGSSQAAPAASGNTYDGNSTL